jgi:hypothetical protein
VPNHGSLLSRVNVTAVPQVAAEQFAVWLAFCDVPWMSVSRPTTHWPNCQL